MAISEKIRETGEHLKSSPLKKYFGAALFFMLGFLFSLGSVLSSLHPFGIAAVAVSKKNQVLFTAAGALLGIVLSGIRSGGIRYGAAILIAAVGVLLAGAFSVPQTVGFSTSLALIACAVTGAVNDFAMDAEAADYALTAAESMLCGGGAYFFFRALQADVRRLRLRALPLSEISCIIISAALLLMNLTVLRVGIIAPANAVAVFLILLAGRFWGERYAVVLSLAFGFALGLSGEGLLYKTGALAFSAMMAALLTSLPDFMVSLVFVCSVGFFCIASGADGALGFFLETAIGALCFVLLPESVYSRLEDAYDIPSAASPEAALRQSLALRLKFAGAAMAAISESVTRVRETLTERSRKEHEKSRASVSREEYAAEELITEKTNQIRMVASDQLFTVSDMLQSLAGELDRAELFHAAASAKIRRLLGEYEIYPYSISAVEDKNGRMRVEILTQSNTKGLRNPALCREIGRVCNRYFSPGSVTAFRDEVMLSFYEKPCYSLKVGTAQYSAEGELCGDTVKVMQDGRGQDLLIISDGMGVGAQAALDGAMGAGLLGKLIHAGFGFDSSLKIINSALLVKSNEESLATLDIACVDLFTGKCELLKAGAPASYIIKNTELHKCELSSMPAGILRGIEFARRTAVLSPGDRLILLSDGITDLGEAFLKDVLTSLNDRPPQECADLILERAVTMSENRRMDDMSVIVAKLEKQ